MDPPIRDLRRLLAQLDPLLRDGRYVFVTVTELRADLRPVMVLTEDEGLSLIVEQHRADAAGLAYDAVTSWITLRVHSAIDAVGLTAAVSGALTTAGISCNVVAGTFHDHLFVPVDDAERAIGLLAGLGSA